MINFASLFGSFNRGGNSVINDLLERPQTTLQQLLDIETFPNEYKSGNNKIIEYMKYPKYQSLVSYVTVQGPADNQKKGYKFPMVAADILSVQNSIAMDFFLPDNQIQIDVQYQQTQEIQIQVDDNDEQYLTEQTSQQTQKTQQTSQTKPQTSQNQSQQKKQQAKQEQGQTSPKQEKTQAQKQPPKPKKKIIKQTQTVKRIKKQKKQPLMTHLLSYYQGPVNYTLAGYNCKVLSTLFTKKPTHFLNFIFKSTKNYVQLLCNHIESKSVGDLVTKILIWENVQFVQQRKRLYDHLIHLMSELKESHVISNLAYTLNEIIQKTSSYIKSKVNIMNNQQIIKAFLNIFYRTEEVHKVINNTMSEDQNRSGYNCLLLHAYLHHTEIETFNSFKIQQVLQAFITKATEKLRAIPNRRTLGMGRVKIVQIFSFLIRKQRKVIQQDNSKNQMTGQLLEQLYIHSIIAKVTDFFTILIKLVQAFENNNILHNQVFRIFEAVLKQPQQNGSLLQQLLLNDENVLLKFILTEAQKDKQLKNNQKHTRRRGYIGHVINICRLIDQIQNNTLLSQKIKNNNDFQQVLNTMVAADITETNKNLAGYQMKKNPTHEIMFQKEDILAAYSDFLSHCPKPIFQPEERESSQDEISQQVTYVPGNSTTEQTTKKSEDSAQKQLQQEQMDEQRFNQVAAVSQQIDQSNPKFWITHMNYDVDQLMQDVL